MVGLLARLSRSVPLVLALIALAIVVYFVVTWMHSSARAKEVLIKMFTVLCTGLGVAFGIVTVYALVDGNTAVVELAASFAAVGLLGLVITQICAWRFKKNHPHYKWKPRRTTFHAKRHDR